ncbi:MAG: cytochrome P450 [bacterium]|nr:cytochrome P450 [bacterium]
MPKLDEIDLSQIDLYRQGFPHHVFDTLREEAPVWWHPPSPGTEATEEGFWVLSRHTDIQAADRDTETFSAGDGPTLVASMPGSALMITHMDGPRHVRLRKLISAGFTPRMTKRLEDQARGWAIRIIEDALERETVNFVQDVAYQLPMHMIADIVGIPIEDREYIFNIVNDMLTCSDPEHPIPAEKGQDLMREIFSYGASLSEAKRAQPVDDVWSLLTAAEIEGEDGEFSRLQSVELDGFFVLLAAAGSETTRSAIAGGLQALLERPDQFAALRANPGLMKTATDEILRWTSPVAYFRRTVTRDTEFGGVKMVEGDRISLWYPSGNRDSAAFDDPYQFDVTRSGNEHIAFGGGGPHFCLGANLARREITIMFEELLARVSDFELVGDLKYGVQGIGNPITVALKELPIRMKR